MQLFHVLTYNMATSDSWWMIPFIVHMVEGIAGVHVKSPSSPCNSVYVKNVLTQQVLRLDFADSLSVFTVKDLKDNIHRVTASKSYELPRDQQIIFDFDKHLADNDWLSHLTGDLSYFRPPHEPRIQLIHRFITVRVQLHREIMIDVRIPNVIRMVNSSLDLIKEIIEFKLGLHAERQVILYLDRVLQHDAVPLYNGNPTVNVQLLIKQWVSRLEYSSRSQRLRRFDWNLWPLTITNSTKMTKCG